MTLEQVLILVGNVVVPIAAVIVSFLVWAHAKKEGYAKIFSSERMEWIKELRVKLWEFAELLLQEEHANRQRMLFKKKFEIETYLNYQKEYPDYGKMKGVLEEYVLLDSADVDLTDLLCISQEVLSNCYERAKYEAGNSKRKEQQAQKHNYGDDFIPPQPTIQETPIASLPTAD